MYRLNTGVFMLILALICQDLYAVPHMLSQQGRLIDSSETPVEGTHFLTFRMFDSNIATTPLWEETLSVSKDTAKYNKYLLFLQEAVVYLIENNTNSDCNNSLIKLFFFNCP